ncbi:MAG: F0F1 ATP synthase subunit delta [Ilumatobacteraceae bacterium]
MAECGIDANGDCVTHSPILPETPEIIWGGLASIIIFALLVKFAGPAIKKGMAARLERIQKELDGAAAAKAAAATEATQIRQAEGDIAGERARILAEADAQATAVLEDGRARLRQELADLETRTRAEIAAVGSRAGDELRAEIARLSRRRRRPRGHRFARRRDPAGAHRGLHRTSGSCQVSDNRIDGYARALFEIARAEGTIDEVEDELFRFARSYESSDELRNALTDEQIPAAKRQAIVEDLLGGKATSTTTRSSAWWSAPAAAANSRRSSTAWWPCLVGQEPRARRGPHGRAPHLGPGDPPRRRPREPRPASRST